MFFFYRFNRLTSVVIALAKTGLLMRLLRSYIVIVDAICDAVLPTRKVVRLAGHPPLVQSQSQSEGGSASRHQRHHPSFSFSPPN